MNRLAAQELLNNFFAQAHDGRIPNDSENELMDFINSNLDDPNLHQKTVELLMQVGEKLLESNAQ